MADEITRENLLSVLDQIEQYLASVREVVATLPPTHKFKPPPGQDWAGGVSPLGPSCGPRLDRPKLSS
jgi:hypothetical protein